jgi:hypothetical protein
MSQTHSFGLGQSLVQMQRVVMTPHLRKAREPAEQARPWRERRKAAEPTTAPTSPPEGER